jgi:membrane protein implicated in regulation of membrane protease activity
LKRVLVVLGSVVARLALLLPVLFAFGALMAPGGAVATVLGAAFGIGCLAALVLARPLWKAAAATLVAVACVLVWFGSQTPRNDRDWQPDVSRPSRIERDATGEGTRVTIRDLRDFDWTGADTANPRWTDRTYDLAKLDSLWLVLSYWDGNTAICHTMLSFGFSDGTHLAVSVETRKEVGETYSAWRGFFHQFELFYVLADERDVIGVRAAHRAEDLYMYPLRTSPEARRRLLEDILRTAGDLARTPEWYGALRANCTTTLQTHVDEALGRPAVVHWDTILNGAIDEAAWRTGGIADATDLARPFAEVRAAHRITDAARRAAGSADFARLVREAIGRR